MSYSYEAAVLGDSPTLLWLLNETSGTTAADATGNGNTGTYFGNYTQSAAGPLFQQYATTFAGGANAAAGGVDSGTIAVTTMSAECWFKTASGYANGGGIMSYGETVLNVYMVNNGSVTFGIYTTASAFVDCTSAGAYNDGKWHYCVATYSSTTTNMLLYIDNVQVASTTNANGISSGGQNSKWYAAYGYNTSLWPGTTSSQDIAGTVADFAVYPVALTAVQIGNHWNAGGRGRSRVASTAVPRSYFY